MSARISFCLGLFVIVGVCCRISASAAHPKYCIDMIFEPGGGILLDGRRVAVGPDFDEALKAISRSDGPHRLCLVPNKRNRYAEVAAALAAIQKAGLQINMTAYERSN
ncbi:MAG: hypothetical protein WDM86_12785 [Rhizomicrobium sp.]